MSTNAGMPQRMDPFCISAFTACSAIGHGTAATLAALQSGAGGLRPNNFGEMPVSTYIGRVDGVEATSLPAHLGRFDSRNDRLAWLTLEQDGFRDTVDAAKHRHGASRVAVVFGTSTSSIGATEEGYRRADADGCFPANLRHQEVHTLHSTANFVQQALGLTGVCVTISTACSSSAKAFVQAARLLQQDVADAVVVGGVDSLCGSVLFGFHSLQLVSSAPCRPFDVARSGINIGEAGGFALLEREGRGPRLLGYGESSDAHHMSSPHPEGRGARRALAEALARGGVAPTQIDYVNLHGTASQKNDEVEAKVIADTFPERTHASSTKGWTGHTLGAAGILESVITLLALEHGLAPGTLNTQTLDPACGPQVRVANAETSLYHGLNLSFGFGGSNCVLLFGRQGEK
ncbi:MAG: beta-ketoacyl-ACP synthase [Burkholderiales bacterium]